MLPPPSVHCKTLFGRHGCSSPTMLASTAHRSASKTQIQTRSGGGERVCPWSSPAVVGLPVNSAPQGPGLSTGCMVFRGVVVGCFELRTELWMRSQSERRDRIGSSQNTSWLWECPRPGESCKKGKKDGAHRLGGRRRARRFSRLRCSITAKNAWDVMAAPR